MSWRATLGKHVSELRFMACAKSTGSSGLREYLRGSYAQLKVMNPTFPLLVRESEGTAARIMARYAQGKEKVVDVNNMSALEVEAQLEKLVKGL